jgi:tetratricopeptide (TPR) repeat protein
MIVRDEEQNLEACLDPVRDLVDELVVVDTGSFDRTREVAASLGARVLDFAWRDDFAAARNHGLAAARGEWIFWLDADDRLSPADARRLDGVFGRVGREPAGYLMEVVSLGAHGLAVNRVVHPRLFKNDPALRFEHRVHEQIAPAIERAGGKLRQVDVTIRHVGYQGTDRLRGKLERNLRLAELNCEDRPMCGIAHHFLALTLVDLGRADEALSPLTVAVVAARNALAHAPRSAFAREVLFTEITALVGVGDLGRATDAARELLTHFPGDAEIELLEVEVLAAADRLDEAERTLRARRRAPKGVVSAARREGVHALREAHLLAQVVMLQGRAKQAELALRDLVGRQPNFGPGWLSLGQALIAQGKNVELGELLRTLGALEPSGVACTTLRAEQASALGRHEEAVEMLAPALDAAPSDPFLLRAAALVAVAQAAPAVDARAAVAAALRATPLCPVVCAAARRLDLVAAVGAAPSRVEEIR